jgi:hypothetical protein
MSLSKRHSAPTPLSIGVHPQLRTEHPLDIRVLRSFPSSRALCPVYGVVESNRAPSSTGIAPFPWSCGTPTVTSPVHMPPLPSSAVNPMW